MAERQASVEPDPGAWATTGRDTDLALLVLRSRRRDPCAERVAAISQDQADALRGVIEAVLDGIGLSDEQRERAIEILVTELDRVAADEPR